MSNTNGDVADAAAGVLDNSGVDSSATPVDNTPTGNDGNPAWAELLGALPSSLHSQVKPYLEKWDKTAQDRITRVQSEYAPYKDFLGTPPDQIQASIQLAQMIATDPRGFYDRMGQYYGEEWGLGQGLEDTDDADDYSLEDEEDGPDLDLANNPLVQQLQEQQGIIANFLASQMQEQQQAAEAKAVAEAGNEIATEMGTIAQKYGFADGKLPVSHERMILSLAMQNEGMTLTQAAEEVFAVAQPKTPMPKIIAPGGGVPAGGIDTRSMNSKDTKSLVATILAQRAAAQNT